MQERLSCQTTKMPEAGEKSPTERLHVVTRKGTYFDCEQQRRLRHARRPQQGYYMSQKSEELHFWRRRRASGRWEDIIHTLKKERASCSYPREIRGFAYPSSKQEQHVSRENVRMYVFKQICTLTCKLPVEVMIYVKIRNDPMVILDSLSQTVCR